MKKLIAVPVVAVIAAVGAASAAGFAGGVSAGPLQVGQTNDLESAKSARVIEWGYNDGTWPPPRWSTLRVKLDRRQLRRTGRQRPALTAGGTQLGPRAAGKVPAQPAGRQVVRLDFDTPMNAEQLKSVRISIDPGFDGQDTSARSLIQP